MSSKQVYDVADPTADALKASAFAQRIYTKCVHSPEDLGKWKRSRAYYDLVAYINNTSMAIQGHRQGGGYTVSKQMLQLCKIFNWLDRLLYQCHPLGVGQGLLRCVGEDRLDTMESTHSLRQKCHRAYRHWLKVVQEKVFSILESQHYDYGPGNELMFLFFLCGLFKSGILQSEDTVAAALLLFQRYLDLVRRLMNFYRLTPPNVRDNNVIDDRNILPYIWGCAQLCREQPFAPPQWDKPAIMEAHRQNYMLLSSLEHLQKTMDNAPLGVHSYQLWCVLSLSNWPDAYSGLMGTYLKYVLNDFYTVQDLIFCEMLSFSRQPLEYLQRAFLGELPKQETSSSQIDGDEEEGEEEQELELYQAKSEKQKQEIKKQQQQQQLPLGPPVPLHKGLNTEVFLGYKDPRKDPSDQGEDPHINMLRRPRNQKNQLTQKSSAPVDQKRQLSTKLSIESAGTDDFVKLNELLGIEKSSKSFSTVSFYSI
ncbi:serine/threonine-protein phosphatase 2A activator isoform X2 [Drosophila montana]|uniref:serine/threonine-protein phosphatase 2A activator isoform X2 n=1 Tax=Drosophila montana TaxID=40370 RepID=UPI00313B7310